jgi:DNA-binding NtrC family response regulator
MDKRILILEDEIIVAIDLQEVLETIGYSTYVVHNYNEAIAAVSSFKPQLAICDINLGIGANGIDFAKDANKISPQMEIIYVTAFSDQKMVS